MKVINFQPPLTVRKLATVASDRDSRCPFVEGGTFLDAAAAECGYVVCSIAMAEMVAERSWRHSVVDINIYDNNFEWTFEH